MPRPPRIFWVLLLCGVLLRIAAIHLRQEGVLERAPDEDEFFLIARNVSQGFGFSLHGHATAYRDMLLPVVTAGTMKLFGETALPMLYVEVVLSCATAYLLYLLGRRRFSEKTALWMAAGWIFYPAAIIFCALLFTETLFVFLWVLALVLHDRLEDKDYDWRWSALLGLVLGLMMLSRQVGVLFVAAILIYITLIRFESAWKRRWKAAGIILFASFAVAAPWMIRNVFAVGEFTLNTNSGMNLFIGNNVKANGAYKLDPDQEALLPSPTLSEGDRDRGTSAIAWHYIHDHPKETMKLCQRKFAYLWSTDVAQWIHYLPQNGTQSMAEKLRAMPVILLILMALPYMLFVCFGISGFYLVRHFPTRGLFLLNIFMGTVAAVLSFGLPRFHFPLMPAMLVGGGALSTPNVWNGAPLWRRLFLLFTLGVFLGIWLFEAMTIAGV